MTLLVLIIYTRVLVFRPFVCTNCVRVYTIERAYARLYICMRMHLYPREFAFVYTQKCKRSFLRAYACVCVHAFVCMRLRACLSADLITTQNSFACKIFQHSNALWVQKLSGCTICTYVHALGYQIIILFKSLLFQAAEAWKVICKVSFTIIKFLKLHV